MARRARTELIFNPRHCVIAKFL
jgi:hypothetical protein